MIPEYTIYYSPYIFLIIIDSYLDLIASSKNRVNSENLWKLFFEIELQNIDRFLEFSPKISLESYGWSCWLFLWFIVAERIFHHILFLF